MGNQSKSPLKIIRIMDPLLCVNCEHAYIADVLQADGTRKKMFYCSRRDCDNWVFQDSHMSDKEDTDIAA
jgi:hypothetical protein